VFVALFIDANIKPMKKHNTFPGEQEEGLPQPNRPEIQQPNDPPNPEIPKKEIEEVPEELSPDHKEGKKS
jgi:hypothetical protein